MNRYKITLSSNTVYKEIELAPDAQQVKVGTSVDCDIRLRKELFFGQIELLFVKNGKEWFVHCSDNLYLTVGDVRKLMTKNLVHGDVLEIKYQESDNLVFAMEFLIDFDDGKKKYERIIDVSGTTSLTIGTPTNCNIAIGGEYVKDDTLVLNKKADGFVVEIQKTTYGVYINGKKAKSKDIIKDGDFLSISDYFFYFKDNKIWTQIRNDLVVNTLNFIDRPEQNSYPKFNRNTRVQTIVNKDDIEVLDPPAKPQKPKNNLLTRLLPSIGMLLVSGITAFFGGAMIIMSAVSGVMAIVTSVITLQQSKKDYKKGTEERVEKYNAYVAKKRMEIEQLRAEEKETLDKIYISQTEETNRLGEFSPSLFDRTTADTDFLCVKLGDGSIEANRKIKYKKQERLEVEDELQLIPEQISDEFKYVHAAPVVCDFKSVNAVGVVGNEAYRFNILKNLVIDIAARQYFSDVKMVFVAEEKDADRVSWLRMLPHTYDEDAKLRTVITDNESKNIGK